LQNALKRNIKQTKKGGDSGLILGIILWVEKWIMKIAKREEKMKKVKVFSVLVSLALVFGFLGIAWAGTLDEIAKRGELRIACQTQGAPFSFVDRNGERTGSSIDLCEMIGKEMGVKVKFLNYDWDGLIPALLSKKADMLAADMTPTLKRAMKIAFTDPYMYTGSVVFVKQDGPIKSLADVKKPGTKIAVLLGSTGENDAKKAFPEANSMTYRLKPVDCCGRERPLRLKSSKLFGWIRLKLRNFFIKFFWFSLNAECPRFIWLIFYIIFALFLCHRDFCRAIIASRS
jgi:hypothetical protein